MSWLRRGLFRRTAAAILAAAATILVAVVFAGPAPVAPRYSLTRVPPPDVARLGGDSALAYRPALRSIADDHYVAVARADESITAFRQRMVQESREPSDVIRNSEPLAPAYVVAFPRVHRAFACRACDRQAEYPEMKRDSAFSLNWLPALTPEATCPSCGKRSIWRAVERPLGGAPAVRRLNPADVAKLRKTMADDGPQHAWKIPDYVADEMRRGSTDAVVNSPPGFADAVRRGEPLPLDPRVFRIVP